MKAFRTIVVAALVGAIGCASSPEGPAPGKATLWGHLRILPHEGVDPGKNLSGPYGNPRLRDVTFVDYTRPGFAVVYLEGESAPADTLRLDIERSRLGVRLSPANGAVGLGGRVVLRNNSGEPRLVSWPGAGFLQRLAPGEEVSIEANRSGDHAVFILDSPDVSASLFVAPGPFAVVGQDGRWELDGVNPGVKKLHAWHPRFPPSAREVDAPADETIEVNLELEIEEPAAM